MLLKFAFPSFCLISTICVLQWWTEFVTFPVGIFTAPWVVTKVLSPVLALLSAQEIHIMGYLDDLLLKYQSSLSLLTNIQCRVGRALVPSSILQIWETGPDIRYSPVQDLPSSGQASVPLFSCLGTQRPEETSDSFLHEGLVSHSCLHQSLNYTVAERQTLTAHANGQKVRPGREQGLWRIRQRIRAAG